MLSAGGGIVLPIRGVSGLELPILIASVVRFLNTHDPCEHVLGAHQKLK